MKQKTRYRIQKGISIVLAVLILISNISISAAYEESEPTATKTEEIEMAGTETEENEEIEIAENEAKEPETKEPETESPGTFTDPDLDFSDVDAVNRWIRENLKDGVEEMEAMPQEWWDSLLPNQRIMAEVHTKFLPLYELSSGEDGMEENAVALATDDKATLATKWCSVGGGRINRKYLDGQVAFCFDEDLKFPDGASYSRVSASEAQLSGRASYIVWFYGKEGQDNDEWWSQCQVAVWAAQDGASTYEEGAAFAIAYCNWRKITETAVVNHYIENVGNLVVQSVGKSASCYVYLPDDPANQRLATYQAVWPNEPSPVEPVYDTVSASASGSASVTYRISVDKKYAAVTGESLEGAVFEVYDGETFKGTITTDTNGTGTLEWLLTEWKTSEKTERYCSNYAELLPEDRAGVTGYTNRTDAYNAAYAAAQAEAKRLAEETIAQYHTVTIRETVCPEGFLIQKNFDQSARLGGVSQGVVQGTFSVSNEPWKAAFILDKVDGLSGIRIAKKAEFTLYEYNGTDYVISPNYEIIRLEDGTYTVRSRYDTGEQGYLYYTQENEGKFALEETKAPEGYVRDTERYYFQITADGQTIYGHNLHPEQYEIQDETRFANKRIYGEVVIHKYDSEIEQEGKTQGDISTLNGAVYGLYAAQEVVSPDGNEVLYQKDELVRTAVIGESTVTDEAGYLLDEDGNRCIESGKEPLKIFTDGQTNFQQVDLGEYYVAEISAPEGYRKDTEEYRGEEVLKYAVTWQADGESGHVVTRLQKASEDNNRLTLDDELDTADIYSGDWVMKQAAAFVKLEDDDPTEKKPLAGVGFTLYRIEELALVRSGEISCSGNAWTAEEVKQFAQYDFSSETPATLYKRKTEPWSEGDRKWLAAASEENQYQVMEMFSDEKGYFCTPELPFGQYLLVETTVPDGRKAADPMLVTIAADFAMPQAIRYIGNEAKTVYIRIVKKDAEGNLEQDTILKSGASYRIRLLSNSEQLNGSGWNLDADGYLWYYNPTLAAEHGSQGAPFITQVIWKNGSIADAYIELGQPLPYGEYELLEVQAPEGYVLAGEEQILTDVSSENGNGYEIVSAPVSSGIRFEISDATWENVKIDSYGREYMEIVQANIQQKGIVEITKMGEQLLCAAAEGRSLQDKLAKEPFRSIMLTEIDSVPDMVFTYVTAPVAGARFGVYAAENIYSQQVDKDKLECYEELSAYLVYEEGEEVGIITTDDSGYGYLAGLPLGKYVIRELTAGDGFVLNPYEECFEITAAEREEAFVVYEGAYINERQKIAVEAVKRDSETGEGLSGAILGLYTKSDIYSYLRYEEEQEQYIRTVSGTKLVAADTLLATAVTDSTGHAIFDVDLPLGDYYVAELEAPEGYTSCEPEEYLEIHAFYQEQEIAVQTYDESNGMILWNQKTKHIFTKSDFSTAERLSGALLEVYEIQVDSQGEPLRENGEYVTVLVDSWISDRDEVHYFYKSADGDLVEVSSEQDLPEGMELILVQGHLIKGLKEGRQYLFREITAPDGYVGYEWSGEEVKEANREENLATEEIRFTVEDSRIVAEHDMKDQRVMGRIQITKEGEILTSSHVSVWDRIKGFFYTIYEYVMGRVPNTVFQVYVRETIYTSDQTGTVAEYNGTAMTADALIAEITTDMTGSAVLDHLPLGKYYISETAAGDGEFVLNTEIAEVELTYAGQTVPVVTCDTVTYINDRQKVEITIQKRAAGTGNGLAGAVFGLYTAEGTMIETVVTNTEGMAVCKSDLPCGLYYIKEIEAPSGYLRSDQIYEIDASYTGENGDAVLKFVCEFENQAKPTQPEPVKEPEKTREEVMTGDQINHRIWLAVAGCICSILVCMIYRMCRKRKRQE